MTATVIHLPVRTGAAELARLRAIEAAAVDLVRHVAEREACGDRIVRTAVTHVLRDAVRGDSGPEAS